MASRRFDPHRKDRIVAAALDVIAARGVAGASHRVIAAQADVPLGSTTYHFATMDALLAEAFGRYADTIADRFERRMSRAGTLDEAREAVVEIIHEDLPGSRRELVLTHELYTLAARKPVFRRITRTWMGRSRQALEQHFDPLTSRMLDALIEGSFIHAALDTEPHQRAVTLDAVTRMTTRATPDERK